MTSFVTAEIGINHEGSMELAKKMIVQAAEAGADAVKFQVLCSADHFIHPVLEPEAYQIFKKTSLSISEYEHLSDFSKKQGILFYGTPLDIESMDLLAELNVPFLKIASSDLKTGPMLAKAAEIRESKGIIPIISTGMSDENEIRKAVSMISGGEFYLMYCVSEYPADIQNIYLGVIRKWKEIYRGKIGFSDHTSGHLFAAAASALGCEAFEKHFTFDRSREGYDHQMSLDKQGLNKYINTIRMIEKSVQNDEKKITDKEKKIKKKACRKIYAAKSINLGLIPEKKDVILCRPGEGVEYQEYIDLLSTPLAKGVKQYEAF